MRWTFISATLFLLFCCVCECVSERNGPGGGGEGGVESSLHVLFMGLSFIRCLPYMSAETFPYFKNSPAISEIIVPLLVLSWAYV